MQREVWHEKVSMRTSGSSLTLMRAGGGGEGEGKCAWVLSEQVGLGERETGRIEIQMVLGRGVGREEGREAMYVLRLPLP